MSPRIEGYGLFDLDKSKKQNEGNYGTFFIMPLYEINLGEYLENFSGMDKIIKIIDVTSKPNQISLWVFSWCQEDIQWFEIR